MAHLLSCVQNKLSTELGGSAHQSADVHKVEGNQLPTPQSVLHTIGQQHFHLLQRAPSIFQPAPISLNHIGRAYIPLKS